jgi:hypothetical protein
MTALAAAVRGRAITAKLDGAWLGFGAITAIVVVFYVALQAPVIDPPNYLDPWIYTASFVNFHFIYDVFGWTYYPSRLPWVIPGIVVHAIFGPVAAFFVLHALFFFSAGLFAYLVFRHFFGGQAALGAYALLMLSPLFYDAYSNDYPDGALITYLFGGVFFGLTAHSSRRPWLRAFWAGFFLAAAIGTNLFGGIVIACLLIAYGVVRLDAARRPRLLVSEAASGIVGALALLIVCGTFSVAYGGEFLFFMPQVRALQTINPADYKARGYSWLLSEPQLLLPGFAVVLVAVLLALRASTLRRRFDEAYRLATGAALATATLYILVIVWEFAFTGDFLETSYYFSIFNVGIALCLAAAFRLLDLDARMVVVVVAAAILPTLLVFVTPALPTGRTGALVASVLIGAAVVAVALRARVPALASRSVTTALAALIGFTAIYAADAGTITASIFVRGTYTDRRDVQDVAFQLMRFMKQHRIEAAPFQFWYAPREDAALNGIQSVYLWGDSWVGLDMPHVDSSMRRLLEARKPSALVLLCKQPRCHDAPAALARAGYRNRPLAAGILAAGRERVYVRALTLPKFAAANRPRNKTLDFYRQAQSPLQPAVRGAVLATALFTNAVPDGWKGDAAAAASAAGGGPFETTSGRFAYELLGPTVDLQPGRYTVYARGRVVAGGLDLGILDVGADKWIEQRFYWYGQRRRFADGWMATPFTLTASTKVQVILSNWAPSSQKSTWQLREIRLVRSP